MMKEKQLNWNGIIHLLVIYLIWGSTYLAIRIAVREGSGFPPFFFGGSRVAAAGLFLLILGLIRKKRLAVTKDELRSLVLSGFLLWVGGMGMVSWAEQRADSGIAALMIAVTPIWTAMITAIIDKEIPSTKMIAALLLGFSGIVVLSSPTLLSGVKADIWSIAGLVLAGLSWSLGTILQSRKLSHISTFISAGYQQIIGGVGLFVLALSVGEPLPHPIVEAWWAWGYIWFFGSILAFTSFINALRLLPVKIVMTYPYVNPVIAVFLGWLILDESLTLWTFLGAFLILLGIAGVFRERYRETE